MKNCDLIIKKPDLIGHSKWGVILDKKIEVRISDNHFLNQIRQEKIKMSGGCKLICDLKIEIELNEDYDLIRIEYIVEKIHALQDKEGPLNFNLS